MKDIVDRLEDRRVCSLAHNSCRNDFAMEEAAAEIRRLREALREAASFPCTCIPAYYERHMPAPDCLADLVSDDAREALGEPRQCKGTLARNAWYETPEGQARLAETRALMERAQTQRGERFSDEIERLREIIRSALDDLECHDEPGCLAILKTAVRQMPTKEQS